MFLPAAALCSAAPSVSPAPQPQTVPTPAAAFSSPEMVRDAIQTAQSIYIQEISDSRKPSEDFLAFYDGMQSLGRYQLVPTTVGADLILRYGLDRQGAHVSVVDLKSGKLLGTEYYNSNSILLDIPVPILDNVIAHKNKKDEAEWLVGFFKQQAGYSKSAGITATLPAQKTLPKSLTSKQAKVRLQAANKVFMITDGVPNGFFVGPMIPFNLLQSDLQSWGRYKLVSSIAEADLVVEISGLRYVYTADFSRENTIQIELLDAMTLENIWSTWDAPPVRKRSYAKLLYPMPLYADPEHDASVSVQNLINDWKKEVGAPVTK
jgi:hypothetical protein